MIQDNSASKNISHENESPRRAESLYDDFSNISDYLASANDQNSSNKDEVCSTDEVVRDRTIQKAVDLLNKVSDSSLGTSKVVKADMVKIRNQQSSEDGAVTHSVSETIVKSVNCSETMQQCAAPASNSDPPGSPVKLPTTSQSTEAAASGGKTASVHFQAIQKDTDDLEYVSEDDTIQTDSEFSFDDESFDGGSRRNSAVTGALRLAESGHADKQASSPSR